MTNDAEADGVAELMIYQVRISSFVFGLSHHKGLNLYCTPLSGSLRGYRSMMVCDDLKVNAA